MAKSVLLGAIVALLCAVPPGWARTLESPAHGATLSGIGFISGWKCDAGEITVTINDGGHIPVATDQPRADTRIVCGTIHNGFITQMNWALLGDGPHQIAAYDDGVKFASATFTVVTTGEPFLSDAAGECVVPDFPAPGENASFAWNTSTQHLELTDVGSHVVAPNPATTGLERFVGLWESTYRYTFEGCTQHPSWTGTWPFTVNTATEIDTSNGLSIVLPTGYIEGSFPTEPNGERVFSISGRFTDTTGAGTWFNNLGCGGTWTARKIADDPFAPVPEPEPDPIHGRCGTARNTCQAGTPNDSAVADTETHYRWICTGAQGGMSSGTCQAAKPPPPPDSAALRRILGSWRFVGGDSLPDEWTLTGFSTLVSGEPVAVGQTIEGYSVTVSNTSATSSYDYSAYWTEPGPPVPQIPPPPCGTDLFGNPVPCNIPPPQPAPELCRRHRFNLTSATTAQGVYLVGRRPYGSPCQNWTVVNSTTGTRIRAPQ